MADKTLPWMPWYPHRWLTSEKVAGLTIAQEGAYRRLLDQAWTTVDCSLPGDLPSLKSLAKWNGLPEEDFLPVRRCFAVDKRNKGRLINSVLLTEWKKAKKIQAIKSKKGHEAALKRWHGSPIGHPSVTQGSPMHHTIQNKKKKKDPEGSAVHAVDKSKAQTRPAREVFSTHKPEADKTTKGFEPAGSGLTEAIKAITPSQDDDVYYVNAEAP